MKGEWHSEEVLPPKLHHIRVGRQFRLVLPDGRVIVAEGEGKGTAWFVYPEDDPGNLSAGTLDGLVVAELLGYEYGDAYPRQFDHWADTVVDEAGQMVPVTAEELRQRRSRSET
jgi:hypothetical protein